MSEIPINGNDVINEIPVEINGANLVDAATITEPCNPQTLEKLRGINAQIATLQASMQSIIAGYCGAKNWDLESQSVNLSLDTGCFTVTAKV